MRWTCFKGLTSISSDQRNEKRRSTATVQSQDILLRLSNQGLYIGPHFREYLVGLDAECEERLSRRTLGVQSALEVGDALSSFSMAKAATPERTDRTLESDHLHTGPAEQVGAARSAAERRRTAGSRRACPCAYCGRALVEFTGEPVVDSLWALIPCPCGEQRHSRCMPDRAERLSSGRADP